MKRSIRILICLAWLLYLSGNPFMNRHNTSASTQTSHIGEAKFAAPPGEETPDIKNLIDKAQVSLASGKTGTSALLIDPAYLPAHEWPRFRKLIRHYGRSNQATIVTSQEPGKRLVVSGTIRNKEGDPVKGALVYVYQTSAKGWYSEKAPHISGMAGDEKYARLFGYLTTNQQGQYEFHTIRPAGYPQSNLPAHIHIEIEAAGHESRAFISEIQFEDDPRLTKEMRDRSARERLFIFPVKRQANGMLCVKADFQIQ